MVESVWIVLLNQVNCRSYTNLKICIFIYSFLTCLYRLSSVLYILSSCIQNIIMSAVRFRLLLSLRISTVKLRLTEVHSLLHNKVSRVFVL